MNAKEERLEATGFFRNGVRKIGNHSVPGLFAGTTGKNSSCTNNVAVKCPVHKSTNHNLQECKVFERMSTNEKPLKNTIKLLMVPFTERYCCVKQM